MTQPPEVTLEPQQDAPERVITQRRLVYALCWVLVFAGAVSVPMPFFSISPGASIEVADLIVVQDRTPADLDGSAALLAVSLRRPSLAEWVIARFDPAQDVVPMERYLPSGQEDEDYFDDQAIVFDDALTVAAAVALDAAGLDVTINSTPAIVGVMPRGPAEGHLLPGDLVLEVNGVALSTANDLIEQAPRLAIGDRIDLRVERDGQQVDVTMTAGQTGQMERPGLGVTVDTSTREIVLPIGVALADDVNIGGPSAGLMFAVTVYDLVSEENLLAGRRVAGTGTMEADGRVGKIGSIRQKVAAAIRDGYQIFLSPADQVDDAREAAGNDIVVLPVVTFADALEQLRTAPQFG